MRSEKFVLKILFWKAYSRMHFESSVLKILFLKFRNIGSKKFPEHIIQKSLFRR